MTCALYSTPSRSGTISKSVSEVAQLLTRGNDAATGSRPR